MTANSTNVSGVPSPRTPRPPAVDIDRARDYLRRGQIYDSKNELTAALACYDQAISQLHALSSANPFAAPLDLRHQLALAWMNRGNVLQKFPASPAEDCHPLNDNGHSCPPPEPDPADRPLGDERLDPPWAESETARHLLDDKISARFRAAVSAYDQAIILFETLPFATEPALRNHLGAAWLNRAHALMIADKTPAALTSLDRAIEQLESLPLDANPFYRLNLAGAWCNRAHLQLVHSPARARASAQRALVLLIKVENETPAFAEMSLRARRALVIALGQLLAAAECHVLRDTSLPALATEASDAIDDGLALARTWETRGRDDLRPLALRLFRLGAQLYRVHQPHFLAEFLLENLSPPAPFAGLPEFLETAQHALRFALAELLPPYHLVVGSAESEKLLATVLSLRDARSQLFSSSSVPSPPPLVPPL